MEKIPCFQNMGDTVFDRLSAVIVAPVCSPAGAVPGRLFALWVAVVAILGLGVLTTIAMQLPPPVQPPAGLSRSDWTQIRTAVVADAYDAVGNEAGVLSAPNSANGFEARFDADGFALASEADGWRLPVRFAGHGWAGAILPAEAADPTADGDRVEFDRGSVTEWYLNKPTGVEQGFTIARAPAGSGDRLEVALDIGGGFTARPDGRDAKLIQASTGTEIDYDHLVVTDARGHTLPSRMEVERHRIVLSVDTRGAAFPVVIDPTFTQQQKLLAADRQSSAQLGFSVAVSGDTAVVGAFGNGDGGTTGNGAAYVFIRAAGVWTQQQKLLATDKASFDAFGSSVAVSGDTVVVGAASEDDSGTTDNGAAYVFTRAGSVWTQQQKLLAADKANFDRFGVSVAVSGDTAVIGASSEGDSGTTDNGAAYVFIRTGGVWAQQQKLLAADKATGDFLGYSVAVSGDTAVVGAGSEDDSGTFDNGAAYVFIRTGSVWTQQQKLLAPDKASADEFGTSVAVSGDTALIGAQYEADSGTTENGAAYVFTRTGGVWTQQQKLLAADKASGDNFGYSVAVSGDTALVGAYREDDSGTTDNGAAYVFSRAGGVWTQQPKLLAADKATDDRFGTSVAVSGDTAVVGAWLEDDSGVTDNGAAYVFTAPAAPPAAVPTLPQWAMILFGLILAGGAATYIQRRQMAA